MEETLTVHKLRVPAQLRRIAAVSMKHQGIKIDLARL